MQNHLRRRSVRFYVSNNMINFLKCFSYLNSFKVGIVCVCVYVYLLTYLKLPQKTALRCSETAQSASQRVRVRQNIITETSQSFDILFMFILSSIFTCIQLEYPKLFRVSSLVLDLFPHTHTHGDMIESNSRYLRYVDSLYFSLALYLS